MEVDFNFGNKYIYGLKMLETAREYNLIPEEISSEKGRMADDGTLSRVLFFDIVHQSRILAGISSVDATNCYDRVAHSIASMVF